MRLDNSVMEFWGKFTPIMLRGVRNYDMLISDRDVSSLCEKQYASHHVLLMRHVILHCAVVYNLALTLMIKLWIINQFPPSKAPGTMQPSFVGTTRGLAQTSMDYTLKTSFLGYTCYLCGRDAERWNLHHVKGTGKNEMHGLKCSLDVSPDDGVPEEQLSKLRSPRMTSKATRSSSTFSPAGGWDEDWRNSVPHWSNRSSCSQRTAASAGRRRDVIMRSGGGRWEKGKRGSKLIQNVCRKASQPCLNETDLNWSTRGSERGAVREGGSWSGYYQR